MSDVKRLAAPTVLVSAAVIAVVLAVAYAYDSSNEDRIARGVSVAGVELGGMPVAVAREALEADVAAPLRRPVRVSAAGRSFVLSARRARLRTDVDAMLGAAVVRSRSGNFVSRAWRDASGGSEHADLPARISYSRRAVSELVREVASETDRPARDARVTYSGAGLTKVSDRTGREVRTETLGRSIRSTIARPGRSRTVAARVKVLQPKVRTRELAKKYPHFIVVNRGGFRLTYYRRLKSVRSYPIAVGQAGLETPAGMYDIENKAVNPAWHVPNSDWAGELAGRVIPGGASDNPLKARWMGIYAGAGIHGTSETESLGTNASHGCIRMSVPEVIELYKKVPVKTPVYIG